jgi:cobalt-zinc-cadmium efflux system membrane fusion protein
MKIYRILNCFILAILVAGCHRETNPELPPTPRVEGDKITFPTNAPQLGYLTVEPVQEREEAAVGLYGRLAWDDDLTVRVYSPVAGRVIGIPVEVNQRVAAGDTLASLDSPDFGQALANARTAVGNLAAADKALVRAKELFTHGAAAQKDVEAAEAAYVAASAEKDRAEATLANYGGSDASTNEIYSLCSPLAGVLVEKNISPGQEIRPDLMLANAQQFINPQFVVTDPTRLWLILDVDELIVTSLASGREVFIHTPAYPGKIFHGWLEIIGHELDPTTRTIKARCLVDNGDNLLRAEMYVTADVASSGSAGVNVPTKSLFLKGEGHCVFVETAPGQFVRRAVKPGVESDGRTAVLDGISSGERVVSEGSLLLESILEGDNP